MESKRWGVIYSSGVGSVSAYKHWCDIHEYLEKKNVQYDFVQSEGTGSVARLTKMLCDNGYHTIVIVGNDASLNEALNSIMVCNTLPEDFALGLLPNGIGNDFAKFWGIEIDDYKKSVDGLIARKTKKIDVGYCVYTDSDNIPYRRYFLNCVNIGLGAKMIDLLDKFQRITGSKRLSMIPATFTNILEQKSFKTILTADAEKIEIPALSICIGNCRGYGQTPNAVPYNGRLDMSIITRPESWKLLEGFWLLERGRFLNYKNVHPYRVEKLLIEEISKAKVSLDGLMLDVKTPTPMRIGVETDAIKFIV